MRRQFLIFLILVIVSGADLTTNQSIGQNETESRWPEERQAGPFFCHADFALAAHESLLGEIGLLRSDVGQSLKLSESDEPIHLFLFQRKDTYTGYMKKWFPTVPNRRALFIKNRGPGMVFAHWHNEFDVDVRHECTHAVLHASLPMVPLWLDEGLAEYFEVRRENRAYGHSHLSTVRMQAILGHAPQLVKLERLADLSQMGVNEYRAAWAWTHFMLHGSEIAYDELTRFLKDIEALTPPGQLSDRLRRRIPNLEQQFLNHFKNWKPNAELASKRAQGAG